MKRVRSLYATVAVAAVALAACSSGGKSASDANSSNGGGASPSASVSAQTYTGEIKVGQVASTSVVSAAGNPEPSWNSAVQALVDTVNAAGGINGKKLVLETCDDKANANAAANCARQFIKDGVVATVGDSTLFGSQESAVLTPAGIPRVGAVPLGLAEYTDANSYPNSGGAIVEYQGAVKYAASKGLKGVYLLYTDTEGAGVLPSFIQPAVTAAHMAWKGKTGIPIGAADLSPYVTAAMKSDADVVLVAMGPDGTEQLAKTATQLGATFHIAAAAESFSNAVAADIGKNQAVVTGALLASAFPPVNDNAVAGVKEFNAETDALFKAGDKNAGPENRSTMLQPWVGAYAFVQIAKTITGDVTSAAVVQALKTVKDVDMLGVMPPWTPSASVGSLPRITNGAGWYVKFDNGVQVADSTEPQQIIVAGTTAG
jgi:ABC-type branched-subunit amino acid transport system substrate-binding protein